MGNSTSFPDAVKQRDVTKVREFLQSSETVKYDEADENGLTPLMLACSSMNMDDNAPDDDGFSLEIIELLLEEGKVDVNRQDEKGWSGLHHACHTDNLDAVLLLASKQPKVQRDRIGLLPQDYLVCLPSDSDAKRKRMRACITKLNELAGAQSCHLELIAHKANGFRPVLHGSQIEHGSLITVRYNLEAKRSNRDYIQMYYFYDSDMQGEFGEQKIVPTSEKGEVTFTTADLPCPCTCHFLYIGTDINAMNREVLGSSSAAWVRASVSEPSEFDIYLTEGMLEVETLAAYGSDTTPLLTIKRIGYGKPTVWANVNPGNTIVEVDGQNIEDLDVSESIERLRNRHPKRPVKLRVRNYKVVGDGLPAKALGSGIMGTFAFLSAEDVIDTARKRRQSSKCSPSSESVQESKDDVSHNIDTQAAQGEESGESRPQPFGDVSDSKISRRPSEESAYAITDDKDIWKSEPSPR